MGNHWDTILEKINKYTYKMSEYEKSSLLRKYASLSLEGLVYEIEFENDPESEKRAEEERVEVIKEEDSEDEEDWDEE